MKKPKPLFVIPDFNFTGKILLPLGIILLALKILSSTTKWFHVPDMTLFLAIGSIIIGLYLIYIVPKE